MAQDYEIKGATTIYTDAVLTDTFVALGITDHDDAPEDEITNHELPIFTNESGPNMPAKVLNMGKTGNIRANLIRWDATQMAAIVEAQNGLVAEGDIGVLGGDKKTFAVRLQGVTSGSRIITFHFCRLIEPFRELDWGNKPSRTSLAIAAYPDPSALGTSTTPLYTISTVA